MKRIQKIVVTIAAAAVLFEGYYLPFQWANWQDARLNSQTEEYEIENRTLLVTNQMLAKLQAANEGNFTMVDNASSFRLTDSEVCAQLSDMINTFSMTEGILSNNVIIKERYATPVLVVDSAEETLFRAWDCTVYLDNTWSGELLDVEILVDDETGKLLSYWINTEERYDGIRVYDIEWSTQNLSRQDAEMQTMLAEYYDVADVDSTLHEELSGWAESDGMDDESGYLWVTYTLTDSQGEQAYINCGLRLYQLTD